MAHLTEEELINEVMHLHSLYRQGPPLPNPNPPFINPNFIPNSPIFNPIYPITRPLNHVSNPNHIPHSPIFNFNPGSVYPVSNPRPFPVLNHDHVPSTHIYSHDYVSVVPTIPGSDARLYPSRCVSNVPVSNVYPYLQRNVERVQHSNLNKRFGRLSLGVQGTKLKRKNKKKGKWGVGGNEEAKKWPTISENEWPCNPVPEEPAVGWPELKLKPAVERVLTEEENAQLVASKSQQKALDAAREMFQARMDSDGEVEEYVSSDDEDDDDDDDECEEYKFFSKVFEEDSDLRCYYEKNCESGEFSCLVCFGIGQKVGKKFKDCVALVQHSITIAKTKKRQAHRAFGEVICKVLGWEIQKFISIKLPKPCDVQGNDSHVHRTVKDGPSQVLPDTPVNLTTDVGPELMVCVDSFMASDGNGSVDTLVNGIPSTPKK